MPTSPVPFAERPCIHLVDDDPAVVAALKFALEVEGFAVVAYPGADAILAANPLPSSGCLVIDYLIPDMNGLDLLKTLRGYGVKLPAILITSAPGALVRQRAADDGVAIVLKPLIGPRLSDAVRRALAPARVG